MKDSIKDPTSAAKTNQKIAHDSNAPIQYTHQSRRWWATNKSMEQGLNLSRS
jgi:hypothetical protein